MFPNSVAREHASGRSVWRSRGLRWGATAAAALAASLITVFALTYWRTTALLLDTLDRSVEEQLDLLSARPPEMLVFMISSRMNRQPTVLTLVGLFNPDGTPIVGDVTRLPAGIALDGRVHAVLAPFLPAAHWRVAGRQVPDGRILVVARGADEIREVQADLMRGAAFAIAPVVVLSLGAGALVGVLTERRLRRLNAIAERIIAGELHERLPANADGDELDRLCAIVNRMLGRLEEGVDALRGAGEDIAHDLRTPLTALRARLERASRMAGTETELGRSILQSILGVDQSLAIVTALLRISEIRHVHRQSAFTRFDLADIVRATAENFRPVAEEKGVRLTCSTAAPAMLFGDRQLMVEVLVNLVDNAVKFTPAGGRVSIVLAGTPGRPLVTVADSGPGIPREERPAVFRRFYRTEPSRTTPGSGLGLSLVAAVMKLHGFDIELGDNHPGCRVVLKCWRDDVATVPPPVSPATPCPAASPSNTPRAASAP